MNRSLVLALAAGCAIATPALAQQQGDVLQSLPFGGEIRRDPIGYPSNGGYGSRVVDTVYDCLTATFGNGSATHLGTCSQALEDISFAPGPWGTAGPGHLITEITYGVGVITTPTTTEDILIIFWDKDDVNFQGFGGVGTSMINGAAVPLAVLRVDAAGLGAGFYWQITNSLAGLPGGGVAVPATDNGVAVQVAWVNDGYVPTH